MSQIETAITHAKELLANFLAEHRESKDGGWATMGPEDLRDLYELLKAIIFAKWAGDADGWRPVVVDITDRTKHITPAWMPQPRYTNPGALTVALSNLMIALDAVNLCLRLGHEIESELAVAALELRARMDRESSPSIEWPETKVVGQILDRWKEAKGE